MEIIIGDALSAYWLLYQTWIFLITQDTMIFSQNKNK